MYPMWIRASKRALATACCLHSNFNFIDLWQFKLIAGVSPILICTVVCVLCTIYNVRTPHDMIFAWHRAINEHDMRLNAAVYRVIFRFIGTSLGLCIGRSSADSNWCTWVWADALPSFLLHSDYAWVLCAFTYIFQFEKMTNKLFHIISRSDLFWSACARTHACNCKDSLLCCVIFHFCTWC